MDKTILSIIYVSVFIGMLVVSAKLLLDSNLEKIFKQGKVASIRVFYILIGVIFSSLVAWAFTNLSSHIYNIIIQ